MIVGLCVLLEISADTRVNVTVYYESVCPDSRRFINTQLYPALTGYNGTLADEVNLWLIPYGKSSNIYDKQIRGYNFSCHHGEDECHGNKIHACGLKIVADGKEEPANRRALDFINCLMADVDRSQTPNVFPITKCVLKTEGVNAAMVENCAKHVEGQKYLASYGFKTDELKPPLTSVPTITFNGKDESQEAQTNFVGTLCKYLPNKGSEVAKICDATGTAARSVSASLWLPLILSLFFAARV